MVLQHARSPIDIRTITGPKWPVSINLFNHFWRLYTVQKSAYTDTEAHADECVLASSGPCNKANIFLGLIEYELNSLLGANYVSIHIRFDLERYLLIIIWRITETKASGRLIILHS